MTRPSLQHIAAGMAVPPREVPLSLQRLVMEAAVNRDFAPIHHDMAAAQQAGAPGAFANYMFLQSVAEFTIREWAGPAAVIERIALKLRAFNAVGMVLRCGGEVREVTAHEGKRRVVVAITMKAGEQITTTGECVFTLPENKEEA